MTTMPLTTAVDLLLELDRVGVQATLKGERISLQPASTLPAELLALARDLKPDLTVLLDDPRRRWHEQTSALLASIADDAVRDDLRHIFDEREAIASIDGGLDDDHSGQIAYETIVARLP